VRAAALNVLVRVGNARRASAAWRAAIGDEHPHCRRRAADLTPELARRVEPSGLAAPLLPLLEDRDLTVVEAAAWALGELGAPATQHGAVEALARTARTHPEPIAREAAVAALGALGDVRGLEAILEACNDKPAIRRRAVLALAPFEGEQVNGALQRALADRDWQVRQAAEDLLG
jgi:HEAT repeat protein